MVARKVGFSSKYALHSSVIQHHSEKLSVVCLLMGLHHVHAVTELHSGRIWQALLEATLDYICSSNWFSISKESLPTASLGNLCHCWITFAVEIFQDFFLLCLKEISNISFCVCCHCSATGYQKEESAFVFFSHTRSLY